MDFCVVLGTLVAIYYVSYLVLLCILDCDAALGFSEYFGTSLNTLRGQVIWITGASSGIGEAMAYEVAKHGGKLILSARRENELQRVKSHCLDINKDLQETDILVLPLDMTATDTHRGCFDLVLHQFGEIDILINNAGRSQRANWENIKLEVDRQMFELNVFGVISLSRMAVHYFQKRGRGYIAVTSSLAGLFGVPYSGTYTGTKHALHGYFGSLRSEKFGSGLSVTLLCPGPVFSNFLQESFTEEPGQKFNGAVKATDRRMKVDRCAKLSLIAIVNKLDEAWIALFPLMLVTYAAVYFPNLFKALSKRIGARSFQRLRDSRVTVET